MPHTAILYIAERCNQKCVFCLEEDGGWAEFVDPSTQQVFDVVDRLHGRGARHITFMGGETFFRKDLPRILEHAKGRGYTRLGVTTNGTVLSKPGFIRKLVDAGLDFIEFSLHGHTRELANSISRSKITFDRQASALAEIDEIGTLLTILNVVICRENHEHLLDIARHVCDGYPRIPVQFKLKFVSLQGWAVDQAAADGRALAYRDVDFTTVGDFLAERGAGFWYYNVPLCHLGPYKRHAHEVSVLSVDERYFDFDHRDTADYYDSGHQLEGRVWPAESCRPCTLRPVCPGLEESYRRAHGAQELATSREDAVPLLAFAMEHRASLLASSLPGPPPNPADAAARLAQLEKEDRPERFVRRRPEGALRLLSAGRDPLDVIVDPKVEGERAFTFSARFSLSYRSDDGADHTPDETVLALLERAANALREADAAGDELADVRRAVARAATSRDGWTLDESSPTDRSSRKKKRLFVLPDVDGAVPGRVSGTR
jgi:organic radical activating enzyme